MKIIHYLAMAKFEDDALMLELVGITIFYFVVLLIASASCRLKQNKVLVACIGLAWLVVTGIFLYSVIAPALAYCEISRVKLTHCNAFTDCPQKDECTKNVNGKRDKLRGYAFARILIDLLVCVIWMQ